MLLGMLLGQGLMWQSIRDHNKYIKNLLPERVISIT